MPLSYYKTLWPGPAVYLLWKRFCRIVVKLVNTITEGVQEAMKKKVKKKSAVAKPAPVTLIGYPIANECICGDKVEMYDRQEMLFDHEKQKWFRLCEDCIEKRNRVKKHRPSVAPVPTIPTVPIPPLPTLLEFRS